MKIKPHQKKCIEDDFYHYLDFKRDLDNERERIIYSSPQPPDGNPRGNLTSDNTAKKAIALYGYGVGMRAVERCVTAVELMLDIFGDFYKKVFDMLYIKKRQDYYAVCDELHISIETLRRKKNEMILKYGCDVGIIKSFQD